MCPEKAHISNEAGRPDHSFGMQGEQLIELPGFQEVEIKGLCIDDTRHKIYVAATVRAASAQLSYALIRLNPDGSFDTGFAGTGHVTGQFREGVDCRGISITLLASGSLLLCGVIGQVSCLACYDTTGRLDEAFGTAGKVVLDDLISPDSPIASDKALNSVAAGDAFSKPCLLPDGKILLTSIHRVDNLRTVGLLVRLNSNGSLDTRFKGTGYLIISHPLYSDTYTALTSVSVQPDGKYLGFGTVWDYGVRKALLLLCDANGDMDSAIGPDGFRIISSEHPSIPSLTPAQLVEQSDNRMLVIANSSEAVSGIEFGILTSLTGQGTPDSEFHDGRQLFTNIDNRSTRWSAGAIQDDRKIVVTGQTRSTASGADVVVARLLKNAQLDPSFNGKGWVIDGEPARVEDAVALALQKDRKIIVAGFAGTATRKSGWLRRYWG